MNISKMFEKNFLQHKNSGVAGSLIRSVIINESKLIYVLIY
jgi:hypothetical protein